MINQYTKHPETPLSKRAVLQILNSPHGLWVTIPHISLAHNLIYPFLSVEVDIERIILNIRERLSSVRKTSSHSIAGQIDDSSAGSKSIIRQQLIEIGRAIYADSNIRGAFDYLLEHKDQIKSIRIVTNIRDDLIPWDLAFLENKYSDGMFFCEMFSCGISILDQDISLVKGPAAFQPNDNIRTDDEFIIYGHNGGACPEFGKPLSYLAEDCSIIEKLAGKYFADPDGNAARVVNLANKPRNEFLHHWELYHDKCRVLYLQGHFENGKLYTPEGSIDAAVIIQWMGKDSNGLDRQPIIFLNGCTSILGQKPNQSENSNMSLAKALIEFGASACIMTRGPVYEGAASQFAQVLFYGLLAQKHSLGESLKMARFEVGLINDQVWSTSRLLYTLYGDPDYKLWYTANSLPNLSKNISRLHSLTEVDAADYYESTDFDPWSNFNVVETTLSHILRMPTSILGGKNFSQAIINWLDSKDVHFNSVVEIGAGLGHVAYNFINAKKNINIPLSRYHIIDISPNLIDEIGILLEGIGTTVIMNRCDARALPFNNESIDGLVLSIGMIADLYSIRVNENTGLPIKPLDHPLLSSYLKFLAADNSILKGSKTPYYLHIGAFDFIRELSRVMAPGAFALIGEYRYSDINAIANFGNHQECGIRFSDLITIAKNYGFRANEFGLADVLEFDLSTKLLTMDIFSQYDMFNYLVPILDVIHKAGNSIPVRAYTISELRDELMNHKYKLRTDQIEKLLHSLEPYFFTLDDPGFDSVHPDTWHYSFILLEKLPNEN